MEETNRLSYHTTYKSLDKDAIFEIATKIRMILDKALNLKLIDTKTYNYIRVDHLVTPVLPNIHKCLDKLPGCPIVASTDSIFSPLAKHLEKIFAPLVGNTQSYRKDIGHFLETLKGTSTISATLIGNSLYTSISHYLGILAARELLTHSIVSNREIQFCIDLLMIILKDNYF